VRVVGVSPCQPNTDAPEIGVGLGNVISEASIRKFLGAETDVAEFKNDIRRARKRDGIEKAKERGPYRGRPSTIDEQQIAWLANAGLGATAIARRLGISRASVYRLAVERAGSSL
jgi:DNA invertase Pin-like site-specific DNA recombinase